MLGKPKFNYDDRVGFKILENGEEKIKIGTIGIIDKFGTFFDDSDVSYDILVEEKGERCLYKHIREDGVWAIDGDKI